MTGWPAPSGSIPLCFEWLPRRRRPDRRGGCGHRPVDAGARSSRAREIVAIEPAAPLRELLNQKLARAEHGDRARVIDGFFDDLPLADDCADLVVAVLGAHARAGTRWRGRPGGDGAGLQAGWLRRRSSGRTTSSWLAAHGYQYVSFGDDEMFVEFASPEEAAELTEIFYPGAAAEVRRRRSAARSLRGAWDQSAA